MGKTSAASKKATGVGQLSLVEHALCPLDPRTSLVENLVFRSEFAYTTSDNVRRSAKANVFCPLGLSAADELYLWGLLALTLLQPDAEAELFASPHWCLRQLGVINQQSKRGGRQYRQFADAIRRLSTVTYMNDAFYDPIRKEHRRVGFHFFSYSLPVDPDSCRAWRITWDPVFFEFVKASAGHFRFDLAIYRELDAASRRLFLFVSKILTRKSLLKALRLEHVAVNLLGFSSTLATREMKAKVSRCLQNLVEMNVLAEAEVFRTTPGTYFVRLVRGPYFERRTAAAYSPGPEDTPLYELLLSLGFDEDGAARLIRRYPRKLLVEWADITQAAKERFGVSFFFKSPMAYLVDSVSKAADGKRMPPDWWLDLKRAETQQHNLSDEGRELFSRLRSELFGGDPASEPSIPVPQRDSKLVSISAILGPK